MSTSPATSPSGTLKGTPEALEGKDAEMGLQCRNLVQKLLASYHPNTIKKVFPPTSCLYFIKLHPLHQTHLLLPTKTLDDVSESMDTKKDTKELQITLNQLMEGYFSFTMDEILLPAVQTQLMECHPHGKLVLAPFLDPLVSDQKKLKPDMQVVTLVFMIPFGDPLKKCVIYTEYTYLWAKMEQEKLDSVETMIRKLFPAPEIACVGRMPLVQQQRETEVVPPLESWFIVRNKVSCS